MEIMGQNLDLAFDELGIEAVKVHETNEKDYENRYQVWEVSESAKEKLNSISDDEWKPEYGWWRSGGCIFEGSADTDYTVNGHPMQGYVSKAVYEDEENGGEWYETSFKNFGTFMEEAMNLTTNYNFVYFAESLAKDNGISLSEFLKKYQG